MNPCLFLPIIVMVISLLVFLVLSKPWEIPDNKTSRIIRSIIVGVCTSTFSVGGLTALDIANSTKDCRTEFSHIGLGGLLCLVIPFGIIASAGNYISYKRLEYLYELRKKIKMKKKQ